MDAVALDLEVMAVPDVPDGAETTDMPDTATHRAAKRQHQHDRATWLRFWRAARTLTLDELRVAYVRLQCDYLRVRTDLVLAQAAKANALTMWHLERERCRRLLAERDDDHAAMLTLYGVGQPPSQN